MERIVHSMPESRRYLSIKENDEGGEFKYDIFDIL
jgi:hypothetical protein